MNAALACLVAAALFAVACVDDPEAEDVDGPPPLESRIELVPIAPSANHVWIDGHWGLGGSAYSWQPGQWVARPAPQAVYLPGRWERQRRRWVYVDGGWRY